MPSRMAIGLCGRGEMVYAADLKSVALWACGFKSRRPHQIILDKFQTPTGVCHATALAWAMRVVLLALLLILAGCGSSEKAARPADTLVRISDADARGLDPQMLSDLVSTRIASDQFEGLTRFDGKGEPEAGLAKDWIVSTDGKAWTFQLRDGLRFSDGVPIAADVFADALVRIRDKKSGSPHASLFAIINSISAANPSTVVVILNYPFPQLPALLAHPAMAALPFHRIDSAGEKWTADRPLVTSGPYRLAQWKLNQKLQFAANPHWHGGKPVMPKLIWRPVDNMQTSLRIMLAGGADTNSDFPTSRLAWLKQKYPELVKVNAFLGTYYFAFNTRRPPFNDVRVRLALAGAIDRNWIAKKMVASGNEPAWGLLPGILRPPEEYTRKLSAFQPSWSLRPRAEMLEQSRTFLAEAGYGPANPLRFEIRFNSSSEHRRAAVAMATMWREIGVEAKLLNSEASLHFDSLKRGDFDLARSGWIADLPAPENYLSVHRSDAGAQNYSGYANPAYDKTLDDALAEPDPAKRAEKMRQAEMILIAEAPILPLYFYVSRSLVQKDVTGWRDNPANVHPSRLLGRKP